MNKIRVRMIIGGNFTDYTVETKVKSESGFKDFIKRYLKEWGFKPLRYRYDLIVDDKITKTEMTVPIVDARFF